MAIINKTKKKILLKTALIAGLFLISAARLFGIHSLTDFKKILSFKKIMNISVIKADIPIDGGWTGGTDGGCGGCEAGQPGCPGTGPSPGS